jgi:hypothetical protein
LLRSSCFQPKPKPKPKATQTPTRLTQEERLADALEMEDENVEELRTWLADEEKKRADRRPAPKVLRGPKLTTLSIEAGQPIRVVGGGPDDVEGGPPKKKQRRAMSAGASRSPEQAMLRMTEGEPSASEHAASARGVGSKRKGKGRAYPDAEPEDADVASSTTGGPRSTIPVDDEIRSARNYLHLSHPPSTTHAEMALLFGDHVDWGQPAPKRASPPSAPPPVIQPIADGATRLGAAVERELCVITGRPARYKDPKTGKPYATVEAYAEIQRQEAEAATSRRRSARSALKSLSPVARTTASRRRNVRIAPSAENGTDSEIEYLAGPPSPVKSVGSAGGRSHKSNSTGDELVMEAWE